MTTRGLGEMLAWLFGIPKTMDPDELEDRVDVLEAKVKSNQIALQEHTVDPGAHTKKSDGTE